MVVIIPYFLKIVNLHKLNKYIIIIMVIKMEKMVKTLNENQFKSIIVRSIVGSSLLVIIGLIMYLFPSVVTNFIGYIVGAICFISGIDIILKYFQRNGARLYSLNIIFGLLLFILGIVIIITPNTVTKFITICTGLIFIIKGGNKISYGSWLKVGSHKSWSLVFTTGVIQILFGILLFLDIFDAIDFVKLIGLFIIVTNVLDIIDSIMIKNKSDEIVKIFW